MCSKEVAVNKARLILDKLGIAFVVISLFVAFAALCVYVFVGPMAPFKPYLPQMVVVAAVLFLLGALLWSIPTKESAAARGYTSVAAVYLEQIALFVGPVGMLAAFGMFVHSCGRKGLVEKILWFALFTFFGLLGQAAQRAKRARIARMDPVYKATTNARRAREQHEREAERKRSIERTKHCDQECQRRKLKKAGLICPACGSANVVCIKKADRDEKLQQGILMDAGARSSFFTTLAMVNSDPYDTMRCLDCGKEYRK